MRPRSIPAPARAAATSPATTPVRAADVNAAFLDPEVEGILCLRGGYGAQRLYPRIDWGAVARNPKPLFGYSDITFFHAMLQNLGIRSFHTPMPSTEWHKGLDLYTERWLRLALFGGEWGALPNCDGAPRTTVAPAGPRARSWAATSP